jgi:hypothetical protein
MMQLGKRGRDTCIFFFFGRIGQCMRMEGVERELLVRVVQCYLDNISLAPRRENNE